MYFDHKKNAAHEKWRILIIKKHTVLWLQKRPYFDHKKNDYFKRPNLSQEKKVLFENNVLFLSQKKKVFRSQKKTWYFKLHYNFDHKKIIVLYTKKMLCFDHKICCCMSEQGRISIIKKNAVIQNNVVFPSRKYAALQNKVPCRS